MRGFRVSVAGLMAAVVVVALGVVGLKQGTYGWAAATYWVAVFLIVGAGVRAAGRRGATRAFWGGFAAFGGAVFLLSFYLPGEAVEPPPSPVAMGLDWLHERIHPEPEMVPNPAGPRVWNVTTFSSLGPSMIPKPGSPVWRGTMSNYLQVGMSLASLVAGFVGGLASRLLAGPIGGAPCPACGRGGESGKGTGDRPAS